MYNLLFIFYFIVLTKNQKSKYKHDTFNDRKYIFIFYIFPYYYFCIQVISLFKDFQKD